MTKSLTTPPFSLDLLPGFLFLPPPHSFTTNPTLLDSSPLLPPNSPVWLLLYPYSYEILIFTQQISYHTSFLLIVCFLASERPGFVFTLFIFFPPSSPLVFPTRFLFRCLHISFWSCFFLSTLSFFCSWPPFFLNLLRLPPALP